MTKVAIHQPNFLPWLGYFYKIHLCDVFVLLDDVQFVKRSYINRSLFCSPDQNKHLISIPIKNHSQNSKINEVTINHQHGTDNIFKTLKRFYGKSTKKDDLEFINFTLKNLTNYESLCQLNIVLIKHIVEKIFHNKKIVLSSEVKLQSKGEQRIIDLVKIFQGSEYLSGTGAKAYQDPTNFDKNDINLTYIDYPDFSYNEASHKLSDGFSIYDFIAFEGMRTPF